MLPVHLPGTIPLIGRLAHSPVKKRQDQPRPSDDAATFARNWNPPSDTNSSSRPKDSTWRPKDRSSRPNLKRIGSRTPSAVLFGMRRTSRTTTTYSPLARIPTTSSLPGSNNNRSQQPPTSRPTCRRIRRHRRAHVTNPEPKMNSKPNRNQNKKSPPANGQVLESTAHARTAGAAPAQRTEEVSQRTLSHLPITSIDSHIPPPHSALNSSFALPLVQPDLNSSFALPPTHSALLPVNDIFLKQPPVRHSVTLGHAFTAPNHPPRTPINQSTERELSLSSLKSTACTPSCAGRHSSLNNRRRASLQLQSA